MVDIRLNQNTVFCDWIHLSGRNMFFVVQVNGYMPCSTEFGSVQGQKSYTSMIHAVCDVLGIPKLYGIYCPGYSGR